MINYEEYLLGLGKEEYYAIVTYNGVEEPTYFKLIYDDKNGNWIMPSPCQLMYGFKVNENDLMNDLKEYVEQIYMKEAYEEIGIEKFIEDRFLPFIKNGIYYELESWQCLPYMPKEVEDIKLVTEKELFDWTYERLEK